MTADMFPPRQPDTLLIDGGVVEMTKAKWKKYNADPTAFIQSVIENRPGYAPLEGDS